MIPCKLFWKNAMNIYLTTTGIKWREWYTHHSLIVFPGKGLPLRVNSEIDIRNSNAGNRVLIRDNMWAPLLACKKLTTLCDENETTDHDDDVQIIHFHVSCCAIIAAELVGRNWKATSLNNKYTNWLLVDGRELLFHAIVMLNIMGFIC